MADAVFIGVAFLQLDPRYSLWRAGSSFTGQ